MLLQLSAPESPSITMGVILYHPRDLCPLSSFYYRFTVTIVIASGAFCRGPSPLTAALRLTADPAHAFRCGAVAGTGRSGELLSR